jgi:hypothetical protein
MEKKSDNRVCMDNKAGFENSNLLNPVGSQARDHQSTSESAESQPEWSMRGQIGLAEPGRCVLISVPYLGRTRGHVHFLLALLAAPLVAKVSLGFIRRPLAGSVGPIVGRRVVERHRATWDLAGNTAILQGVGEIEAGSEQCKEQGDEKLWRVVCRWIEICRFDGKVGRFLGEKNGMDRAGRNAVGERKR